MSDKVALCVEKQAVRNSGHVLGIMPSVTKLHPSLYGLYSYLIPRSECETNPQFVQLIPYIVIIDPNGFIFTYVRGKATGEERLKAKLSIGLGGHVDEGPLSHQLLQEEACRELKEEIGLDLDPDDIKFEGLIYEEVTEVGTVHLGLLAIVQLKYGFYVVQEEGHIESGQWLPLTKLAEDGTVERLELWSQAVLNHLTRRSF
jgi:predicted NUDIX family phosphoesterase